MPLVNYTRLPGRFRGFFRGHSLWMAEDHLLIVDSTRVSETYQRFYLRDIQTIIVRKTPRFRIPYYWTLLAVVAVVVLLASTNPFRPAFFWPSFVALAGVVLYVYIASMFQSCTCHLMTRVTKAELPSLFRLRAAQQFVDAVSPRLIATQGQLSADWIERSATLEENVTAADRNPDSPVDLLPSAEFSWLNVLVFALVALDGLLTIYQLQTGDPESTSKAGMLNLIALAVAASFALVRLTRQKASAGLRGLVLGGLLVVGAVMYASSMLQSIDQQFYHQSFRNPLRYSGMKQLAWFEVLADAAVALPGMILAFRLKESAG